MADVSLLAQKQIDDPLDRLRESPNRQFALARIADLHCSAFRYTLLGKETPRMSKRLPSRSNGKSASSRSLVVRLDEESKAFLAQAAQLRGISVSAYVRQVTVEQARREVRSAEEQQIIRLSPEAQLAFWTALNEAPRLTEAQKRLGSMMRGQS